MLKKAWKTIPLENNGKISIYGNNREIDLQWGIPEWKEEKGEENEEQFFQYKGNKYFLSEFIDIHNEFYNPNPPEWMKKFDGYINDTYFSGIVIKLTEDREAVKVYTYTC